MSSSAGARFFFDYVDPASFLLERLLAAIEPDAQATPQRVPFELRPPPAELIDPSSEQWRVRWADARAVADVADITLTAPAFIPWTRKAHELAMHAGEHARFEPVHRALFEAFHLQGRDLGRVDVLLAIAVRCGLDLTHTKAVLDVDRHTATVEAAREEAERLGIPGVPALLVGSRWLVGLQDRETLLAFLRDQARA